MLGYVSSVFERGLTVNFEDRKRSVINTTGGS